MMQKYESPEAEIILFADADVITTSPGGTRTEDDDLNFVSSTLKTIFNLY